MNNKKRQDSLFKLGTLYKYWVSDPDRVENFYADDMLYYRLARRTTFGKYKVIKARRVLYPNGEVKILPNKSKVKKV